MTPTGNDKWKCFVIGISLFLLQFAGTAMAADSWAGYPDSAFAGGSCTKDDPWQIARACVACALCPAGRRTPARPWGRM